MLWIYISSRQLPILSLRHLFLVEIRERPSLDSRHFHLLVLTLCSNHFNSHVAAFPFIDSKHCLPHGVYILVECKIKRENRLHMYNQAPLNDEVDSKVSSFEETSHVCDYLFNPKSAKVPSILFTEPKERTWRTQQTSFRHFITYSFLSGGRLGYNGGLHGAYKQGNI